MPDLFEQVDTAHLDRALTLGERRLARDRLVAFRLDEILDGMRHGKHRVNDEVNERVLSDVETFVTRAQATRRRASIVGRVGDVLVHGAVELLLPEFEKPRIASV